MIPDLSLPGPYSYKLYTYATAPLAPDKTYALWGGLLLGTHIGLV